jgi:glycerol-1-phosphate dehydrogenase [NAD(P)+]
MNPAELFGKTFRCECGKTHAIEPLETVYSDDAMDRIPLIRERLSLDRQVAVLMDSRTREAAGWKIAEVVSGEALEARELIIRDREGGGWPVCDDQTKDHAERELGKVDWILTVGSGVLTDLGKWMAFERDIPFIGFATAASMNGYASANVAPTVKGVKSLLRARPAKALLSSPKVLLEAPYEMTTAGLGDVLAKSTSTADWRMNHQLFNDFYCEKSAGLIADLEPLYLDHPEGIRDRKPEAMKALFEALLLTGVSMTMAETSSPASGGEHLISHTLDMMSSMDGHPHDLHGRQVGVATVLAAELYRRVLSIESPVFHEPPESVDIGFWGPFGHAVQAYYKKKLPRIRSVREKLATGNAWDAFRETLSPMLHAPEKIKGCLQAASAAIRAEDIGCGSLRLKEAFLHAHEIRSRFTILDLARLLGLMPESIDEIVEPWA